MCAYYHPQIQLLLIILINVARGLECGYALRQSSVIDGLGVFATRDYLEGEVIDRVITVFESTRNIDFLSFDYAFNIYEDDYYHNHLGIALGVASMLNHHNDSNVAVVATGNDYGPRLPSHSQQIYNTSLMRDWYVEATRDIQKGEELFYYYGDSDWFEDRGFSELSPSLEESKADINDGLNLPGCALGLTEIHDGRVFAKNNIPEGTVIEVTRGLITDEMGLKNTTMGLLMWESLHEDLMMLLFGHGGLYRSRDSSRGEVANMNYSWYFPPGNNDSVNVEVSVSDSDLVSYSMDGFGASNPLCSERMLIQFVANRDINANEELLVSLYKNMDDLTDYSRFAAFSDCF